MKVSPFNFLISSVIDEKTDCRLLFEMKLRTVNISRVFKKTFLGPPLILIVIFHYFNSHTQMDGAESDHHFQVQLQEDQSVRVYKLSEKKEMLKNSTTNMVYPLKPPTREDADSKSLVPKILHFMWIGSEVPGKYQENIIAWKENNPTYQVGEHYRQQSVGTFLSGSLVDGQV